MVDKDLNKLLEKYAFAEFVDSDFNSALGSLALAKRIRRKDIKYALLRDSIISYIRPFSGSKTTYNGKNLTVRLHYVPREYTELHKKLHEMRNQLFAHTDVKARRPKFARAMLGIGLPWMSIKGVDYEHLCEEIDAIALLVKKTQKNYQTDIEEIRREIIAYFSNSGRDL